MKSRRTLVLTKALTLKCDYYYYYYFKTQSDKVFITFILRLEITTFQGLKLDICKQADEN